MEDVSVLFQLRTEVKGLLQGRKVIVPESRNHLLSLAMGSANDIFEVAYNVDGVGLVVEATVTKCKNGLAVNYTDMYMRRRDPDCMVIADKGDTDKVRYSERFNEDFEPLRNLTFEWLRAQKELIVMPFMAGGDEYGYPSLLIAPANAGFFAGGLADLQGFIPKAEIPKNFCPKAVIYLAPTFRHTHFNGNQIVVHNRLENLHELFSFNLYPGPSAKKGAYGILLNIGETEGWVTLHGATVKLITPYDNELIIMHEGASGGGKSEMIGEMHRRPDGRVQIGQNIVTKEKIIIDLSDTCELQPITDDMALCPSGLQLNSKKLVITDAEQGWFLRVDHIKEYGTEPQLEKLTIHPPEPLIFLNLQGKVDSSCLIWEHTEDEPGKSCPNPRVIMPRRFVKNTIANPVEVDVRSFGIRTPPSTKENPNYGIVGMLHVLPMSIAWLWRLVAPRGYSNPSITDTEGLSGEGVGSYWPFATGKMVNQANLLLEQMINTPSTRYKLIPNQHIGAYKVGFMPEWIAREYIARRGSTKFKPNQLEPARCPLLGYSVSSIKIDGTFIPSYLLRVNEQPEVKSKGYDKGAVILTDFFKKEASQFYCDELHPMGKEIIEILLKDGSLDDYLQITPYQ